MADTENESRLFGEVALGHGLLSREQLESALARQEVLHVPLGEVLVEMSVLTPSQVAAILKLQRVLHAADEKTARGEPRDTETLQGQMLGGCLILERLGRGAMGTAYKAHHMKLDRDVCLKVLHPELVRDKRTLARFTREARAAAKLEHPGIVSVYDFEEEGPFTYIVLQLVDGKSLKQVLDMRGAMGAKRATFVAARIADALACAHRAGIVHRDVKPANVLVAKNGQIKLTDFGLVRVTVDERAPGTASAFGELIGTPTYMSPEQAQASPDVDGKADVYALGVVTYELATGKLPFEATTLLALLKMHMLEPFPSLKRLCPDCPRALDDLLQAMCVKDPAKRMDAASAARDLRSIYRTAYGSDAQLDVTSPPTMRRAPLPESVAEGTPFEREPRRTDRPTAGLPRSGANEAAGVVLVTEALEEGVASVIQKARLLPPQVGEEVSIRIVFALHAAGRDPELAALGEALIDLARGAPEAVVVIARACLAAGDRSGARKVLEEGVSRTPDDIELVFELAQLQAHLGERDGAQRSIESLVAKRPRDTAVHRRAAELRSIVLRDLEGAAASYGMAADLDRNAFEPRQQQGFLLLELGRVADAVKALEDAVARCPGAALAHELLGKARRARGDISGARAALRRALELEPSSTSPRLVLIDEAREGKRWIEVVALAQEGLARSPGDRDLLEALAQAHEALGDASSAARIRSSISARR